MARHLEMIEKGVNGKRSCREQGLIVQTKPKKKMEQKAFQAYECPNCGSWKHLMGALGCTAREPVHHQCCKQGHFYHSCCS